MTPAELDLRIRQMHAALSGLTKGDPQDVVPEQISDPVGGFYSMRIDFGSGLTDAELMNMVEKLVENIARIKDHLKVFCDQNSVPFTGDHLINNNRNVAIIHDLWNTQKHAELSRPRSGCRPVLKNMRRVMMLTAGGNAGSFVGVFFDPVTGEMKTQGDGETSLVIDGDVVDENGNNLGSFLALCEDAIQHWELALRNAGVQLPT
jgi:hypothetical protein